LKSLTLNIEDPLLCPREHTIAELAEILDQQRVVLVRGTPSTGKSTLAYLLDLYFRGKDVASVRFMYPTSGAKGLQLLVENAHAVGYTDVTRKNILVADIVWIIDEAQLSYHDTELWYDFIKAQHGRTFGPRICTLSSYGSPSTGPDELLDSGNTPLAHLGVASRVSLTPSILQGSPSIGLFYSREEFDSVLEIARNNRGRPLLLDPDATDYVFSLTNGHPGAVTSVLQMLKDVS